MSMDVRLLEHMMNPKNYGVLKDANTEGIGKNPNNGEKVAVYLKMEEDGTTVFIADIAFQAIGCTTTVVAGSMITEEARGLDIGAVRNLIEQTMNFLDKIPPEDAACSEMVALALGAAVDTYEKRLDDPKFPLITYHVSNSCVIKEAYTSEERA